MHPVSASLPSSARDETWQDSLLLPVLLAFPFIVVLIRSPDNFFADDSFFYFQTAWNIAHGRGSTFNGLIHTNGYHPLWLLACTVVYSFCSSKVTGLHAVASLIAGLNVLTLTGLTMLLRRADAALPFVSWAAMLIFLFTSQLGTESALSATCVVATLLIAQKLIESVGLTLALSFWLCSSMAFLSRLDNVFFVVPLAVASLLIQDKPQRKRLLLHFAATAPLALLLSGTYLLINHHFFGTWQPISGLLKAHSHEQRSIGSNLPHIAWLDLVVIVVSVPLLLRKQRDRFLLAIELPLAAGVLLHAMYIILILSSETRWTWYYTVWTLLATILTSRLAYLFVSARRRLRGLVAMCCALAVCLLACRNVYLRDRKTNRATAAVVDCLMNPSFTSPLLAFDKAGRASYYSSAHIISLDGLTGDLQFQKEIASDGIDHIIKQYGIQRFVGPPQPLSVGGEERFCRSLYLSSVRFSCSLRSDERYDVIGVEVFDRLSGSSGGFLELSPSQILCNVPNELAVWRIAPKF